MKPLSLYILNVVGISVSLFFCAYISVFFERKPIQIHKHTQNKTGNRRFRMPQNMTLTILMVLTKFQWVYCSITSLFLNPLLPSFRCDNTNESNNTNPNYVSTSTIYSLVCDFCHRTHIQNAVFSLSLSLSLIHE